MAEGGLSGLFSRWSGARASNQTGLDGTNVDKKTLERVQKLLEKLVRFCDSPQLGLKRSPPYLLDLLPHMYQTLQEIFKNYESRIGDLNANLYFRTFIDNLCAKLKRGIKLFRDNRAVYNENSSERKTLTRLSLHISHMLYELRALFPNSHYIGSDYRITKEEAAEFWRSNFGERCIISWKDFRATLSSVHPITSSYEAMALKSTIDLTHNDMVSIFEFDVFTRLFQPWETLLINWKMIAVTHTGYQAFLTYGEVKERLQKWILKPGTYIFRLSCTRLGQWAIGYVTSDHEILQTIPQNKSLCDALILGAQDGYYLYPDGQDTNPDLTIIQHEKKKKVIQVTEEEYEIYTSMGSTFQQCKICQENDKDVKLQPCNHLLCSECLFQWQEHDKSTCLTCPFCRAQVNDYEHVEVDPFQKGKADLEGARATGIGGGGAPPIPNRKSINSKSQMGTTRQAPPPPPPLIPRRPGDDAPPPNRPPPLPPPSHPSPSEKLPLLSQPPPILSAPPSAASSGLTPNLPPARATPSCGSLSSAMSATNPFFSDVQALRSTTPAPPPTSSIPTLVARGTNLSIHVTCDPMGSDDSVYNDVINPAGDEVKPVVMLPGFMEGQWEPAEVEQRPMRLPRRQSGSHHTTEYSETEDDPVYRDPSEFLAEGPMTGQEGHWGTGTSDVPLPAPPTPYSEDPLPALSTPLSEDPLPALPTPLSEDPLPALPTPLSEDPLPAPPTPLYDDDNDQMYRNVPLTGGDLDSENEFLSFDSDTTDPETDLYEKVADCEMVVRRRSHPHLPNTGGSTDDVIPPSLPPRIESKPLPPIPRDQELHQSEEDMKKGKKPRENYRQEMLKAIGLDEASFPVTCPSKSKPKHKKTAIEIAAKQLKHRKDMLESLGLPGDAPLPSKKREIAERVEAAVAAAAAAPPPPRSPIPSLQPSAPPLPSSPIPTLAPGMPPPIPSSPIPTLQRSTDAPPLPPRARLQPSSSSPAVLPSTAPPPAPPPTSTLPPLLPKSLEENHVIIYETDEDLPPPLSVLIKSDTFAGMEPDLEFMADGSTTSGTTTPSAGDSLRREFSGVEEEGDLPDLTELRVNLASGGKEEEEDGGDVDEEAQEDTDRRRTRYTDVNAEISNDGLLYNNLDNNTEEPPSGGALFQPETTWDWGAGGGSQFDDVSPVAPDEAGIYCNTEGPSSHTQGSSPRLGLPPALDGPKPKSTLENIAIRPTSLIDPDGNLFDNTWGGGGSGEADTDIYENQLEQRNGTAAVDPASARGRLLAQGYSEDEVDRAVKIVGDNYDMALMILQSFVKK